MPIASRRHSPTNSCPLYRPERARFPEEIPNREGQAYGIFLRGDSNEPPAAAVDLADRQIETHEHLLALIRQALDRQTHPEVRAPIPLLTKCRWVL